MLQQTLKTHLWHIPRSVKRGGQRRGQERDRGGGQERDSGGERRGTEEGQDRVSEGRGEGQNGEERDSPG